MAADKVVRVELQGGSESFRKAFADAAKASGDLSKSLGVVSKEIEGSFKNLGSALGPVGEALSALGPAGLGAAAGIGAVATAMGGLVAFVGESVKGLVALGGHLADLSAQTGLSTTTLQELRFAGALVGVSLEDAAGAVGKMQKAITAGDTVFARLGLNLDSIRKLNVAGQFDAVSAAIKGLADPTQQAAAAMEAFGKGGAAILPLIKSDTAAAREEFERLGLSIGEGTISAADKLGDEFDKLGFAFEGVKNQLAAGIVESGALQAATETLKAVLGELASFLAENKDVIRGFFALGLNAARELASFIPTIKTGFQGLVQIFGILNPALKETAGQFGFLLKAAADFQAFQERVAARDAKLAAPKGPGKAFVSQQDIDNANKLAAQMAKLAEEERKATIEANKRSAAEDAAVAKINAAVGKRISGAQESVFGTSKAAAQEALLSFNLLAKALGANIEVVGEGELAYNGLGDAISSLSQGELTALEGQLVKLEKASRGDADTNNDIANTLGKVRVALREAGDGFEKGTQQIEKAKSTTQDWINALDQVAAAFSNLGGSAGELGKLIGQLGQVLKLSQGIASAINKAGGFSKLTSAGKAQAIGAGADIAIGIGTDAFQGASTNATKSVAKGALSGAAKGALAGSVIPGIGTAVGAVVGGVIGGVAGFFGSKKKTKELLKSFDDQLIQQFGSIEKAKKEAEKYGIALDKALDSKKPKAITDAMNKLNEALQKRANLEAGLTSAQESVSSLQDLTKELNNPKLSAAVQALAQKVSDEMLKAGLGFQATGPLRDSAAFKGAQDISAATAGTVGGLRQAGVVDQGVIAAAGTIASEVQKQAFDAAKAAGLGDAEATKASFGAVSDLLKEQLNASLASGRELDQNTKDLLAEAKANGIDILADPAIEAVAVAKDQLSVLKDIAGKGSNVIDARDKFGGQKTPGFAGGGIFRAPPSGGLFVGHGLEAVVPLTSPNMPTLAGLLASQAGANASSASLLGGQQSGGGASAGPISMPVTLLISGSQSPAQVADAVVLALKGRAHEINAILDKRFG